MSEGAGDRVLGTKYFIRPAALLKLDIRYKTLITYQTFDCIIKVKAEFKNKSKDFYNDNEDIAVMMFDINYGYRR